MTTPNPFLLAAETLSPTLLPLLRSHPHLASQQDSHGYSLLHAASSYNHISLLRTLVQEFSVDINLVDEDGETCLFVCETVECVKVLVEELGVDVGRRNHEGWSARERIEEEGEFVGVAVWLRVWELERLGGGGGVSSSSAADVVGQRNEGDVAATNGVANGITNGNGSTEEEEGSNVLDGLHHPPMVPSGISVNIGTMSSDEVGEDVVDPEFRRRIEELAAREDFQGEEGQRALRDLITQAVRGEVGEERDVRQRTS